MIIHPIQDALHKMKITLLKKILFLSLLLFSIPLFAENCKNQTLTYTQVDEDQLLIITLRINGKPIISDMEVYLTDKQLLLPVSLLKTVLKLPININNKHLDGEALAANCNFNWPLTKNDAIKTPPDNWIWGIDEYDDYIDARLLSLILGEKYEFNYSLQQLSIKTDLPLEILKTNQQITRHKQIIEEPDNIVSDEYNTLNYPVISYNINSNLQKNDRTANTRLSLNGYFDILGQSAELRLNHSKYKSDRYLKISRKFNNDESITTALSSYQLGDIQTQRDNLIHTANAGAGLSFTNANAYYNNAFSTITIVEPSLPGWRAELYRNGFFIDEVTVGVDNQVTFSGVDTFHGTNIFSIKLFGPEGQELIHTKQIMVGNKQLAKNTWSYQFNYLDKNGRFIDQDLSNTAPDGRSAEASLNYGITDRLTLKVGSHFVSENNVDHFYLSSNIQGSAFKQNFIVEIAKDLEEGEAIFTGIAGEFGDTSKYKLNYSVYNNFISEIKTRFVNDVKSNLTFKLNGNADYLGGFSWNTTFRHIQNVDYFQNTLDVSLSKNLKSGTLAGSFLYNDSNSVRQGVNNIFWTYNARSWRLSTSLNWLPFAKGKVRSIGTELRWPQHRKVYNQTHLQYTPNLQAKYNLNHNLTFRNKYNNVQFIGQVDNQRNWQITIGITGTLGFDNTTNEILFLQPQALNSGQIEAQVYWDKNLNSIFDENEETFPDVEFSGNYLWNDYKTNEQGKALLPSVSNGQNLKIKTRTLPDPYLQPRFEKVKIYTHKGGVNKVQLAVVAINDIEGSIYQHVNNKLRAAVQQKITLLNNKGEEIATTESEIDGYYFFTQIMAGEYFIKILAPTVNNQVLTVLHVPEKIIASNLGDSIVLPNILMVDKQYLENQEKDKTSIEKSNNLQD